MKLVPQGLRVFRLNSIFIRLLLLLIALILFSILIVGALSYRKSSTLLTEELQNSNMILLNQSKKVIDQHISALDKLTLQISWDARVEKGYFLREELSPKDIELFRELHQYASNIKSSSDIISEMALYFSRSGVVINNRGKFDSQSFFKDFFIYDTITVREIDKIMKGFTGFASLGKHKIRQPFEETGENEYIGFIRTLPADEPKPHAMVMVNIKEELFRKIISGTEMDRFADIYVLDDGYNILISNKQPGNGNFDGKALKELISTDPFTAGEGFKNIKYMGQEYTVACTTSSYNKWKYVSVTPIKYITSKTMAIKNYTSFIILISLMIGLVLAYMLAVNIYLPVSKMIGSINILSTGRAGSGREKLDELGFINKFIDFVFNENRSLKETLSKNISMLREKVLNDLIDGKRLKEDASIVLKEVDLNLPFAMYQIFVLKLNGVNDSILADVKERANVWMERAGFTALRVYCIEKAGEYLVCLINRDEKDELNENAYDLLRSICSYVAQNYGLNVTMGVGKLYKGMNNIPMSYVEALHALRYIVVKGENSIIHIEEVENSPDRIFEYTLEKEKQIINLCKAGDIDGVKEILYETFERNIDNLGISPEMINNLFSAVISTAIRVIYDIQSSVEAVFGTGCNIHERMGGLNTIQEKKQYAVRVFEEITSSITAKKKSFYQEVYDKVNEYVQDHYWGDISLNILADEIGTSPSYLSWIFKEVSGINFVDYVNTVRIDKAKELLNGKKLSIRDIAEKVGFRNSNYFIQVFKKYEGVTPGQFNGDTRG